MPEKFHMSKNMLSQAYTHVNILGFFCEGRHLKKNLQLANTRIPPLLDWFFWLRLQCCMLQVVMYLQQAVLSCWLSFTSNKETLLENPKLGLFPYWFSFSAFVGLFVWRIKFLLSLSLSWIVFPWFVGSSNWKLRGP